ncbi:MAG: hypothetical protein SFY81_09830 [Verrucomicrobiota bacterium]|nr:hypothetical protein [Verrucomicrobiota bacterium]
MTAAAEPPAVPDHFSFHLEQRLEGENAIQAFQMTDINAWKISGAGKERALELVQQSKYSPTVRSPVNIALIKDKIFTDFILEADCLQTGREYGHRDMCFFYGFQSPTNFYYTHIATAADKNAHNIFIVNGAPRTNIATETTRGVEWGLNTWHKVRIERTVSDGMIKVFFDDMQKPIMIAQDKTFQWGQLGFGSFDDTGKIKNIRIWAPKIENKSTPAFPETIK